MKKLTDFQSYADAQKAFSPDRLWDLMEGDRAHLNIATECVDRYAAVSYTHLTLPTIHAV